MNDRRRRKLPIRKVDHYDGQCIYSNNELAYELGSYLGGGAAGVVYEAFCTRTKRHVAIKILNPVGYKLMPSTLLARCIVAIRGKPIEKSPEENGNSPGNGNRRVGYHHPNSSPTNKQESSSSAMLREENVWWLIHPSSKQVVAGYEDQSSGILRELTLPQCIQLWGTDFDSTKKTSSSCGRGGEGKGGEQGEEGAEIDSGTEEDTGLLLENTYQEVIIKNQVLKIPKIPKKFIKFANTRRSFHREISNMSELEMHENVLRLEDSFELVQDSKCTTFLVLELAAGGELFDRIKLDCGTDEDTARRYFRQLVTGVAFCHSSGICHRDLKPENLLLADNEENATLKIADFGLSAIFSITDETTNPENGNDHNSSMTSPSSSNAMTIASTSSSSKGSNSSSSNYAIRRLRSVVGSPHYVAPEVLMDTGQGYDGAKADAWSIGVILYAMIAGNLPFGKDLLKCVRYEKFRKWSYSTKYSDEEPADEVVFPSWFFPSHFSFEVKSLIAQLLYPDACMRLSVEESQRHPWVLQQIIRSRLQYQLNASPGTSPQQNCLNSNIIKSLSHLSLSSTSQSSIAVAIANLSSSSSSSQQDQPQHHQHQQKMSDTNSNSNCGRVLGISPSKRQIGIVSSLSFGGCGSSMSHKLPQKTMMHLHHRGGMTGGYMPSVDEMSILQSTPPQSPKEKPSNSPLPPPFSLEKSLTEDLSENASMLQDDDDDEVDIETNDDKQEQTLLRTQNSTSSTMSSWSSTALESTSSSSSLSSSPSSSYLNALKSRFTSPPLASVSSSEEFSRLVPMRRHSRRVLRRNSPPELFLNRFIEPFQPTGSTTNKLDQAMSVIDTLEAEEEQEQSFVAAANIKKIPPSYHDHVTRSTRFTTALPASIVLSKIETILSSNPSPLPYPFKNIPQRLHLDWDQYLLEVRYGGILTCTVQVFLFQRGVYLVEFRRGQMEIFQFKRFYEDIREKMADLIQEEQNHHHHQQTVHLSFRTTGNM